MVKAVVAAVIVGLNKWDLYTYPCIKSIKATNPKMKIVCVDNGSEPPYPQIEGITNIRLERDGSSYAGGINAGMKAIKADWYIVLNNDILFHQPIIEAIRRLNPDTLYGGKLYNASARFPKGDWINGWFMVISSKIIEKIGYFDEAFKPLWFEDVDYSWRAKQAGFRLKQLTSWGVEHLEREKDREQARNKFHEQREIIYTHLRTKHGF